MYFIVDTYMEEEKSRQSYDEYIRRVKPIVESYGGKYLLRSEKIEALSQKRKPQRVIIIHFPDRAHLEECFASEEYQEIMALREENVDARALIIEEEEENEGTPDQN